MRHPPGQRQDTVTSDPDRPLAGRARLLYSAEEAAELLGIGRTFMFELLAAGEIESMKVGKRRKIPCDALTSYIERLRSEQAPAPGGGQLAGGLARTVPLAFPRAG